jgi:hypothetical protein
MPEGKSRRAAKANAFAVRAHDDDIPSAADSSALFFVIVSSIESEAISHLSSSCYFKVTSEYRLIGTSLAEVT